VADDGRCDLLERGPRRRRQFGVGEAGDRQRGQARVDGAARQRLRRGDAVVTEQERDRFAEQLVAWRRRSRRALVLRARPTRYGEADLAVPVTADLGEKLVAVEGVARE